MDDTILVTPRLRVRYQRPDDVDFLVRLWSDTSMTRYTGGPRDRGHLFQEFVRVASNPRGEEWDLWPLESILDHRLVGQAGFIPKEIDGKTYIELNYYIQIKEWGQGYATEIARALVEYAFEVRHLAEVVAIIDPDNEASLTVAEKIGMTPWRSENRDGVEKRIFRIAVEDFRPS